MSQRLFNRNFTMVLIGQLISLFGNSILRFALSLYVLDITGSATIFGSITAIAIIPTIVLSPFGGLISDRVNRRNIMVVLDFTTSALVLGFGIFLTEKNAISLIAIMLILLSIIQACYTPSVNSSVPLLETEENLIKANAVVNQATMLANLIGPVLGGVLYGFFGAMPIVWVSGICFFASAILEIFIHIPFEPPAKKSNILYIIKNDFKDSIRYILKEQPSIYKITVIMVLYNFFIVSIVTIGMPYMIRTILKLSSELYGTAEGLMAGAGIAGGVISGLIANKLKTSKLYLLLVFSGMSIIPIGCVFLFGFSPMICYIIITACIMVLQLFITLFSIFVLSATQRKTPNHLLGKVTAYIMTMTMCAQPLGQAIYGILFDYFSNSLYLLLIITAIIAALIGVISKKVFLEFDNPGTSENWR